ncbi:hypothetical protein [Facilibium subflavum]|uniref:hypothetical protein n=1 Tax=Facilibium subflavum TaxID=2219058 RepID=UPI000E64FC26|nr:hypothetical protein [Facilibium subflavum]
MLKKVSVILTLSAITLGSGASYAAYGQMVQNKTDHEPDAVELNKAFSDKKFNIEWNVIPTMIGFISANANYKFLPSSAIGIYGAYWTWGGKDTTVANIGVQYSYAVNGNYMSSGWLIKPFAGYAYGKDSGDSSVGGFMAGAMVSYQWLWDSGFNMQLGVGPMYVSNKGSMFDSSGVLPTFEFNIGYSF